MSARSLQLNPLLKTATWEDIKAKRNEIEQSPITTAHGVFDADRDSIIRMDSALLGFSGLPTLVNGELGWKLADNSIVFLTEAELLSVRQAITVRAALIFVAAETIAIGAPVQVGALNNLAIWGL